ncbi:MAG: hypothetical protein PHN55_14710, partial [Dysgonamonadaceae bacterium]|nr:hypothetical protein [Dysgonamonadaceae bacterium]
VCHQLASLFSRPPHFLRLLLKSLPSFVQHSTNLRWLIQDTHGWRYEKLPIAGDFLSSYTKVEAGYNP